MTYMDADLLKELKQDTEEEIELLERKLLAASAAVASLSGRIERKRKFIAQAAEAELFDDIIREFDQL
jgi:molecular chaperone GrpE (heat shock protein)